MSDDEPKYVSELGALAAKAVEAEQEAVEQAIIRGIGLGYGTAVVRNYPENLSAQEGVVRIATTSIVNHPWVPDCQVYYFESIEGYMRWTDKEADARGL